MKVADSTANIKERLLQASRLLQHNIVIIFLLFLVAIYGFLGWQAVSLSQTEPDPAKVTAGLKTKSVPNIDEATVNKIQQLQDNSVSVKSLFDEARRNPFQE